MEPFLHSRSKSAFSHAAFTLVEIMIAVAIIAVLVATPFIFFNTISADSRDDKRVADLNMIKSALEEYKADNGSYPPDLQTLVDEGYLSEIPSDPMQGEFAFMSIVEGNTELMSALASFLSDNGYYPLDLQKLVDEGYTTLQIDPAVLADIQNALEQYQADHGQLPIDWQRLVDEGYLSEIPTDPNSVEALEALESFRSDNGYYPLDLQKLVDEGYTTLQIDPAVLADIQNALEQYQADHNTYPIDWQRLVDGGYISEVPSDDEVFFGAENEVRFGYEYETDGRSFTLKAPLEGKVNEGGDAVGDGGGDDSGGDDEESYYVVTPDNEDFIADNPSPTRIIATATITPSPTRDVGPSGTPTPTPKNCNQTIVCDGACEQISGKCSSYPSTKSQCEYTQHNSDGSICKPMPAPDQPCTASSSCTSGYSCEGTDCVPYCDQGISCTGSCQTKSGRCGSYSSSRSGCRFTSYSGGGDCVERSAPNQSCTATSSCPGGNSCLSTNCVAHTPTPTPCWGYNGQCQSSCQYSNVWDATAWNSCTTTQTPKSCWATGPVLNKTYEYRCVPPEYEPCQGSTSSSCPKPDTSDYTGTYKDRNTYLADDEVASISRYRMLFLRDDCVDRYDGTVRVDGHMIESHCSSDGSGICIAVVVYDDSGYHPTPITSQFFSSYYLSPSTEAGGTWAYEGTSYQTFYPVYIGEDRQSNCVASRTDRIESYPTVDFEFSSPLVDGADFSNFCDWITSGSVCGYETRYTYGSSVTKQQASGSCSSNGSGNCYALLNTSQRFNHNKCNKSTYGTRRQCEFRSF